MECTYWSELVKEPQLMRWKAGYTKETSGQSHFKIMRPHSQERVIQVERREKQERRRSRVGKCNGK